MRIKTLALTGIVPLLIVHPALAGQGWYLGGGIGWSQMRQLDYNLLGTPGTYGFDNNARYDLDLGYKLPQGFRIEGEASYARYRFSSDVSDGIVYPGVHGDLSDWSFFGNGAYDFPIFDQFLLTAGGGLGWARVNTSQRDLNVPQNADDGSGGAFAWQLFGGVSWMVSDTIDVGVEYKYEQIQDTNHNAFSDGAFVGPIAYANKNSDSVMLKLRWYLQPAP